MIRMILREGRCGPLVVCDICGDMISDADEGVAVFQGEPHENSKFDVIHAHKDRCHTLAEKRIGSTADWQELGLHLYWLCKNTEIDERRFQELGDSAGYLPDA